MDLTTSYIATNSAISLEEIKVLFDISKANIERIDLWFSWMLGIGGCLFAIFTIFIALIAFLTWKHFDQAKQAAKLLDEVEEKTKQAEERGQYITKLTIEKKSKGEKRIKKLSKKEIKQRSLSHRGFGPILYKVFGEAPVYAIDENGYRHFIPNPVTLGRMGYSFDDVREITKQKLGLIPKGDDIPNLARN